MLKQKGLKRALALALILCIALSSAVTASATQFAPQQVQSQGQSQVHNQSQQGNNGHHFGSAAKYMINEGFMKGDGNQNYYLSGYVKRGDIAILIVRAFNLHSNAGGNHFGDVKNGDYYCDAVNTAADLGIAKGDGNNFLPESYVTIQQAIWLIERAVEKAGIEIENDLETLYDEEDLTNYATREDVCEMLYFVLTGSTDGFDGEFGSSHGWSGMTVSYTAEEDEAVTFDDEAFTDALAEDHDEETLSYIKFTSLPSSDSGVLYYDYDEDDSSNTEVAEDDEFDAADLSLITFVPKTGFSGTVKISFKAYTEDDNSYSGKVIITIGDTDATADVIAYTTDEGDAIAFDEDDFTDALYEIDEEETLSYVKFTILPSSTAGILYYDYDEDSSSNTKIVKGTSYDVGDLGDITFVPTANFNGSVTIAYAGYTEDETEYVGTVKITVNEVADVADAIAYETVENEAVTFTLSDFKTACSEKTGKTLSGVKFGLPDQGFGTLYYNYNEDDSTNTAVSGSKTYYSGSSPYLSKVTFVPAEDYTGAVTIEYSGYTTSGTTFTGTVVITVE